MAWNVDTINPREDAWCTRNLLRRLLASGGDPRRKMVLLDNDGVCVCMYVNVCIEYRVCVCVCVCVKFFILCVCVCVLVSDRSDKAISTDERIWLSIFDDEKM